MQQSKAERGLQTDLYRVPCPEPVFLFLVDLGASPLVPPATLMLVGLFVLQLLGWLRGDSVAGFTPGDVVQAPDGGLILAVRKMKQRPEFVAQPGVIVIPPAADDHPQARLLRIIARCFDVGGPVWFCLLAGVDLSEVSTITGESRAAQWLTEQLRLVTAPVSNRIPDGVVIGSHSWREMAAVGCYQAKYDPLRMTCHGFWRDPTTMFNSYIRPYVDLFPYSRFLAQVFDFLRAV